MSEENVPVSSDAAQPETPASPLREIVQPFIDLVHAPRALWGLNLSYLLEGLCYFGWLTLLAMFFNQSLGMNDLHAGWMVTVLTSGITFSTFAFGGWADKFGVRKAMIFALLLMFVGRLVMVGGATVLPQGQGAGSALFWVSLLGLLGVILGYGLYQPAAYSGVRQFTDERSSAMGYAMLYALMNLGGFLPAFISPPMRQTFGITGVFWTYVALTAVGLIAFSLILTRKVQREAMESVERYNAAKGIGASAQKAAESLPAATQADLTVGQKLVRWIKNHPLADGRFAFFIFCLIPVQTLFAHNWLTLPQYVDRALGPVGHAHMERFVNLNPILIFLLTPMVAAATRKADVYKMMILGTFVMAAPTFLLAIAPSIWLVLAFIVISSVGEAMWQPRFLQYAAEIAPPGRTGAYMGVAQLPWFLTKMITGLYAGWFLMRYCPEPGKGVQETTTMWFIYACIAMSSTVMLVVARGWVGKNFKTKAEPSQPVAG